MATHPGWLEEERRGYAIIAAIGVFMRGFNVYERIKDDRPGPKVLLKKLNQEYTFFNTVEQARKFIDDYAETEGDGPGVL